MYSIFKNKFKANFIYLIYFPIFINFILNKKNTIIKVNINIFDVSITLLLFVFLLIIGIKIKQIYSLPYISTGILCYLFSFFIFDILVLFFNHNLKFSNLFIFVNLIWIIFIFIKNKISSSLILFTYLLLNYFSNTFINKLSLNKNIIGDVKDIHLQHIKNIFEFNYFYSINNPTLEGYPQLSAYFHALLNMISHNSEIFFAKTASVNVLFLLFLLMFFEMNLSKESKIYISILFTSLIFNSQWLKFLFIDSFMTEGVLSYLFLVTFLSCLKTEKNLNNSNFLVFLLIGMLYFSKQFISTLALLVICFYLINKTTRKYAIVGLTGILLKETSQAFVFSNIQKNYHLKEVNLIDTFFDLILFRNLKLENINIIIENISLDKPVSLILIYLVILIFAYLLIYKNLDRELNLTLFVILINFVLIFLLYISLWRNMELESPIRYILNLLPLILYFQFKILDKINHKFKN